jgi:glycosyltransferase involved in cell wall biosynthesis
VVRSARVPKISIVIATLGRPLVLARTLERLERQTRAPEDFEVIVVSDAADEDVRAVSASLAVRPYATRHFVASVPGVSAARNRGWPEARARLVLFIGDDMLPQPALVAEHLCWHERHAEEQVSVLGRVRWAHELRITPFMRWLEQGIQFDYGSIRGTEAGWWHFYAANASLKRSRLELAGGFDESFRFGYEELDLAHRLNAIGLRLLYNPAAVVEHLHPATIDAWRARMRTVAVAERQFVAKHPDVKPYFHEIFANAGRLPPARGRGARLASIIPRRVPIIGERVWRSADAFFAQALAPDFLQAWDDA